MNTITLAGTHYQTGFQWGSLLSARQHFILEHVPFPITRVRRDYAAACHPVYARYYPELLEELRGLSDGQGCGEEELQVVLFSMYAIPPACACSCLAVAGGGETLFGRNSDFLVELEDYNTNVSCRFTDAGYAYTGSTTAFLEMEDGVNQRGLAAGLTSAWGVHIRPGFHVGLLLRWLLERCGTVEEALAAIRTLPLGSPFTLTLADAGGSVAVTEYDGMRLAVEQPRNPGVRFVCAVNAFHLPGMPSSPPGADNWQAGRRYATMRTALEGAGRPAHRGLCETPSVRQIWISLPVRPELRPRHGVVSGLRPQAPPDLPQRGQPSPAGLSGGGEVPGGGISFRLEPECPI